MKKQKKAKWANFKELLFIYLAITKIMYWMDALTMGADGVDLASMWQVFVIRLFERDILLILSILAFHWLDKTLERKKFKHGKFTEYALFYVIGFFVLAGITAAYIGLFSLIFGPVQVDSWVSFIAYGILGYMVVSVALNIKLYFNPRQSPTLAQMKIKSKCLKP